MSKPECQCGLESIIKNGGQSATLEEKFRWLSINRPEERAHLNYLWFHDRNNFKPYVEK